jgi:hypothetical protein
MYTHISRRWFVAGLVYGLALLGFLTQAFGFADRYTLVRLSQERGYPLIMDKSDNRVITTITTVQEGKAIFTAVQLSPNYHVLGSFSASSVNWPWVAGRNSTGDAVLYHHGVLEILPSLDDTQQSYATCVNNSGDVFGQSAGHPVVWLNGADAPIILPAPGRVYTCNDRGDAAGQADQSGDWHCRFWGANGAVIDCHDPLRAYSVAQDMTSTGMIAAQAWPQKFHTPVLSYVWMWSGIAQLPPYAAWTTCCIPSSFVLRMNDRGDAVGVAYRSDPEADSPPFAVGWESGRAFFLHDRVVNMPDGMVLRAAPGISNDGKILARLGPRPTTFSDCCTCCEEIVLLVPVETPTQAYFSWRYRIWQYYVNQYWRSVRDWYVQHR